MQENKRKLRISPSLIISILALVIASTSGAYAAVTIAAKNSVVSKSIKNGQVKGRDIAKNAVNSKKIKDGQVLTADIGDGQVTSADIADGQIGAGDLSPTALGNYYSKAEADGRYAPLPGLIRGTTMQGLRATAAGQTAGDGITYGGVTLSAPPTPHYIKLGDPVPAGCSGTSAAPNATPGNLCVFEVFSSNNTGNALVGPDGVSGPSAFGAVLYASATAAGEMVITTNWAVRPAALAPPAAPAHSATTNTGRTGGRFLP